MQNRTVERSIWIAAPRERVWPAITGPEHLERWYAAGCPWIIPALKAGALVKFFNAYMDVQQATIKTVDPERRLTLLWQPTPPDPSLVNTYTLEEEDGGTRVTVTQAGYESLPCDLREQWITEDGEVYTAVMENLKAYLEGRRLPF